MTAFYLFNFLSGQKLNVQQTFTKCSKNIYWSSLIRSLKRHVLVRNGEIICRHSTQKYSQVWILSTNGSEKRGELPRDIKLTKHSETGVFQLGICFRYHRRDLLLLEGVEILQPNMGDQYRNLVTKALELFRRDAKEIDGSWKWAFEEKTWKHAGWKWTAMMSKSNPPKDQRK